MNQTMIATREWGLTHNELFGTMATAAGLLRDVAGVAHCDPDGTITEESVTALRFCCQALSMAVDGFDDAPPIPDPIAAVLVRKGIKAWRTFLDQQVGEPGFDVEQWGNDAVTANEVWQRAMDQVPVAAGL